MKKNTITTGFSPFCLYLTNFKFLNLRKLIFFLLITANSYSQVTTESKVSKISGVVSDEQGIGIPGASIKINKTKKGVVSDMDGKYIILVESGEKLTFSFIGFQSKDIIYLNQKEINVKLKSETNSLDEVTIVAFGKQKKASVIGAITTIDPEKLKMHSSNLTTALAGNISGVVAYQRGGEPGKDNADFFIRGVTTFGYKKSPLILIDGIELSANDLARLQPDDIANFSIMKDATATSLYGARGANGVILVNTKEGKEGLLKVNVRYEKGLSAPTRKIDIADPITYMKLQNEAVTTRNPFAQMPYSAELIKITSDPNRNKMAYPAVNWSEELFNEYAYTDRFNFSLSGGDKKSRYYLAATVNQDNGILKVEKVNNFNNNVKFKSVSLRSNVNIDLTKKTEIALRFNLNFDDYTGPIDGGADLFRKVLQTNPVLYPKYYEPDDLYKDTKHILFGNAGQFGDYINPYADMIRGYKDESRAMVIATVELKQNLDFIVKGLNFRLMANTSRESFYNLARAYNPFYYSLSNYQFADNTYKLLELNPKSGTEYLNYYEGNKIINNSLYAESALNYNQSFNDVHSVGLMFVGIIREAKFANAGSLQRSLPYRNMGLSGRFNYSYDRRYLFEANFGYNGSERFSAKKRFGFFPSVGLGWSISDEKFWESKLNVVNKLKLRATYGIVGNDAIGSENDRFFYLSQVNPDNGNNGTYFGQEFGNFISGVSIDRYGNDQITWETAAKTNLGIEIGLFNNFDIQADYFTEKRTNILMDRSEVPSTLGLQAPLRANIGEASSKGFEFSIDYKKNMTNQFWLGARVNFTYAANKFDVFEELDYVKAGLPWKSRLGLPINQSFGLIAERLFIDAADIANSPLQSYGTYIAGDIKYKDINNDGVINSNDEVPIGFPTVPEIIYGFGASAGFHDLTFSFFFQGSARSSFFVDPYNTSPFIDTSDKIGNNALLNVWANDHWSEDNKNIYASWPRLSDQPIQNNLRPSTWFLKNGAFLRLKSVEIGYNFPNKGILSKANISSMRLYCSGTNLLAFSYFKLWDVEMGGNGLGYPVQKVFNLGANINF